MGDGFLGDRVDDAVAVFQLRGQYTVCGIWIAIVGIVLAGALVNSRPMMWYKAWREMLQGVRLMMSRVEHCGGADGLLVGISSRLSSGLTMGSERVGCLVPAGILLGFLVGLGCRSWMRVWTAAGVMAWMLVGMASTLCGGVVGVCVFLASGYD